jgi:hypothetical protein
MKNTFVIPGIPFAARVALYALCALAGLFVQYYFYEGDIVNWGTLVLAAGGLFVAARNYRNKPVDLGFEDWTPVSEAEFARVKDNLGKTRTVKVPVIFKTGFGVFILVAIVVGSFVYFMVTEEPVFPTIVFDIAILTVPIFFSGAVKLWTPEQLGMKVQCFETVLNAMKAQGDGVIVTPYLRLDKDKEGRRIPEDIRFMVEPKRKPADFLGVQFQVAINNGPNGAVPYMYSVFLCKGKGDAFRGVEKLGYGGFIKEPGGDNEYGYVVVRQETSSGGYHTTGPDCKKLAELVIARLGEIARLAA